MQKFRWKLLSLIAVAALLACGIYKHAHAADSQCFADSIRGITLESWGWHGGYTTKDADAALAYIKSEGANTVAILRPYPVDISTDRIDMVSTPDGHGGPPSDAIMIHAIQAAQQAGLDVVLKLHFVDTKKYDVLANVKYSPNNPDAFFTDYDKVVQDNAKLAQQYGVKLLVLGTEMGGELTARPQFKPYFEKAIADARSLFHGKLTYATQTSGHVVRMVGKGDAIAMDQTTCLDKERGHGNWCISSNEADYFLYWPKLDYIGIDLYPNNMPDCSGAKNKLLCLKLGKSEIEHPTRDDLIKGIYNDADGTDMMALLREIQQKNGGVPILITEMGASSIDGDQHCPGCWTDYSKPTNFQIQADLIGADADALCKEKANGNINLAGVMWFAVDAYKDKHAQASSLGVDEKSFTFEKKPASDVIKSYFTAAPH
jgi:hypothetical protein